MWCNKNYPWKKNIFEDNLPFLKFTGSIVYSYEAQECSFFSEYIRENLSEEAVLGFDIEWPPAYKKGKNGKVSLIQVCTSEEECYLFQVSSMTGFPKGLKRLLEDISIKKVGVGIEGDQWKLMSDCDLKLKGFIELTDLANEKLHCKEKWSLNGLVKHLFNKQLLKDDSVRCSDWDRLPLSEDQKVYAASDAYAGLLIYQKLQSLNEKEKLALSITTGLSSGSCEVKNKLNILSQELLVLVDQVPDNFNNSRDAQRTEDILAELSSGLEDLRNIIAEASKDHKNSAKEEPLGQGDVHSASIEEEYIEGKIGKCNEDTKIHQIDTSDQPSHWNLMTEEEENKETIKFEDNEELEQSYVFGSDEEFETEMLKSVEVVEKSPESFSTSSSNSKVDINTVDEEEDEGIEEEEDDEWDPALPEPNVHQISCLKTYFGHSSFKPVQWKVIHSILKERRDNLVVMATGYGKSLCYQFAPVYTSCIGIVISPLISLMEDQVLQLSMSNIPACFLGSAQTKNIMHEVKGGKFKVIYMTPEFCSGGISLLQELDNNYGISLIAIDEAHCISEWGHDFRSAYRCLGKLKKLLPTVPVVALTATASPSVRDDILASLHLHNPQITCTSFDRPNLHLEVARKTSNIARDLQQFLIKKQGPGWEFEGAAIVYCPSRRISEQVTGDLTKLGILCDTYHAGMGIKARRDVHHRFMRDEIQCVVATVAFGMGINKPDIRKVIHYGAPKEMESYYQEIGRAGRDGLPSSCHVLWAPTDMKFNRQMLNEIKKEDFRQYKLKMLSKMEKYLNSSSCRRKIILSHFEDKQLRKVSSGIMGTEKCCDNCKTRLSHNISITDQEDSLQDFGQQAFQLLSAVDALGEKFGTGVPVLFLRGSTSQRLPDRYRRHPLFGKGRDISEVFWKALARQLISEGFLQELSGRTKFATTCALTTKGKKWMSKAENLPCPSLMLTPTDELCPRRFVMPSLQQYTPKVRQPLSDATSKKPEAGIQKVSLKDKFSYQEPGKILKSSELPSTSILRHISPRKPCKPPEPAVSQRELELQTTLYGKLVAARQKIASEKDIPPAVLATNKVLVDMAKIRPTTIENIKKVDGVSEAKAHMLAPLVEIVKEFCLTNSLKAESLNVSGTNLQTNMAVSKGSACIELPESPRITYSLFQEQGLSMQTVSDTRSISLTAVGMHLWQALKAGYPLDVQRAGLTLAIQKTITEVIKGPTINSDLSRFQAIRSLVAPEIDIYLIRMVITLLEKERAGELGLTNEHPQSPTVQARDKSQEQECTQPRTTMDRSHIWIEKEADSLNVSGTNLQTNMAVSKGSACMTLPESPRLTYSLFKEQGLSMQNIAHTRSISLTAVGMHLWQALKAGYPLDVERAGLTPTIQKTITEVIKGPAINSDLSSFQAIRALVAPEIDIYLIRMVITLLEKERGGELGLTNEHPQSMTRDEAQEQVSTQPKTIMDRTHVWMEKEKQTKEVPSNVQKDSMSVVAPIKLASWNQQVLDEDTEELFSESQVQTPKRKLPEWFEVPKETAKSSNTKKAKTVKKKGLFG
ncbi:bifunctional 3'-5' exonuclease/ATP-dependent helicase WRN [Leptodactylus fuscus]|uniref:bifunctional 3'-5' exonuclease/ATP-dependent helicase WRN n=1 Tax=Leptodactylus fuscus TaxID=238119 RepID=UPI003F4EFA12